MTVRANAEQTEIQNSVSRRSFLKTIAAGGAAVGGASAFGSLLADAPFASAATARRGGDLTFARTADPQTVDPSAAIDTESIWTCLSLYECLYNVTADGHGTTPWLATGYNISSDQRAWTFHLRPGVKFSDGRPLDSSDVRFTLERVSRGRMPTSFRRSTQSTRRTPQRSSSIQRIHGGLYLVTRPCIRTLSCPTTCEERRRSSFSSTPLGPGHSYSNPGPRDKNCS